MSSYNRVILLGNVTRDPQTSFLPSQTAVCEFGLAVNRKWKGADGQAKEEVCFVDCRLFGKGAETFQQYVTKGKCVHIEGRLQFQQWEYKDGTKKSKHIVIVDNFQFIGGKGDGEQRPAAQPSTATQAEIDQDNNGEGIPF